MRPHSRRNRRRWRQSQTRGFPDDGRRPRLARNGRFPDPIARGAPVKRHGRLRRNALAIETAELRPVGGSEGRAQQQRHERKSLPALGRLAHRASSANRPGPSSQMSRKRRQARPRPLEHRANKDRKFNSLRGPQPGHIETAHAMPLQEGVQPSRRPPDVAPRCDQQTGRRATTDGHRRGRAKPLPGPTVRRGCPTNPALARPQKTSPAAGDRPFRWAPVPARSQ